jgi:hypothetical protein
VFDESKDKWTKEELEEAYAAGEIARERGETCTSRCLNCRYWFADDTVSSFCDVCLNNGLEEGPRLAREAYEQRENDPKLQAAWKAARDDGGHGGHEKN